VTADPWDSVPSSSTERSDAPSPDSEGTLLVQLHEVNSLSAEQIASFRTWVHDTYGEDNLIAEGGLDGTMTYYRQRPDTSS
jgi:hypothetical protein